MEMYEQELHINDELFEGMRKDADVVLQKLLKNMIEKGSMEGKVTIGIDVTLAQEFIPNRDPEIDGETRRALTPKFSHKVGSVMQIKNEMKGDRNCDGTELVWDEERGEYVLRPIANTEQMTIFDADFHCVNDESGFEDKGKSQPALGWMRFAALPGASDKNCDGIGGETADDASGEDTTEEDMSDEFDLRELPFADDGYGYEEPGEEE